MALPDLTGQNIQDTYQRVLQRSGSGDIVDGTGSLFIPPNAISASYADFAVSASHEIIKEVSSSYAETASYANSFSINGTSRTLFTSCSLAYSGSNVTQVTQSFESGTTQITNILYSGSFADGNPLSIAVTGSDGVNKLYTLTYSASLVTEILVT
jgi:hypothetical protein